MKQPNNADELLCKYLQEVSRALKLLSRERCEAELRQMRAHLQEMAAREIQNGADEVEAMQRAIERFGSPRKNGRELVSSYRGKEAWWHFGAAMVGILVAHYSVQFMVMFSFILLDPHGALPALFPVLFIVVSYILPGFVIRVVLRKFAPLLIQRIESKRSRAR